MVRGGLDGIFSLLLLLLLLLLSLLFSFDILVVVLFIISCVYGTGRHPRVVILPVLVHLLREEVGGEVLLTAGPAPTAAGHAHAACACRVRRGRDEVRRVVVDGMAVHVGVVVAVVMGGSSGARGRVLVSLRVRSGRDGGSS